MSFLPLNLASTEKEKIFTMSNSKDIEILYESKNVFNNKLHNILEI